jgi:hypothetical protein
MAPFSVMVLLYLLELCERFYCIQEQIVLSLKLVLNIYQPPSLQDSQRTDGSFSGDSTRGPVQAFWKAMAAGMDAIAQPSVRASRVGWLVWHS